MRGLDTLAQEDVHRDVYPEHDSDVVGLSDAERGPSVSDRREERERGASSSECAKSRLVMTCVASTLRDRDNT